MATTPKSPSATQTSPAPDDNARSTARSTVGAPAAPAPPSTDLLVEKQAATARAVEKMPFNANKAAEYGELSRIPSEGQSVAADPIATGSTVTEAQTSPKTGTGVPELGYNPGNESLDRVRADDSVQVLTTNQGTPVADNQHSLKAGLRGPALLEDFILREKITHFDHERIPERIVHARGSAAHGVFECYEPQADLTRASIFAEAGKQTPVFVRFSTVLGERGSADTVRDVRGFAVKFYTDEGVWDLVGNNIPVFFIQDAMKFPDLIHAGKPEPHFAIPQASTAHDTFWDFISLMPESAHMIMWVMSDRAIPRSYRMMQGFGVHTFRFVNAAGESSFVKFHWQPLAGTHSLDWDEAVKIAGCDPDFHRRDLWESIEAGVYPEFELGVQVFTEKESEAWSFDILDATKLVPEELVPIRPIGKMTLNRNPDNFFAETEQVAFCTSHVVPGIDFSNDPLLAGRLHSYQDTQISRLGGPNFHELPINASVVEVHNNQRDGMHRQTINRGRVAYEPNSLGGGCPFQAGAAKGFTSFPERITADKVRGKAERFADHYTQAKLFFDSQTPVEQAHIRRALRFELTRLTVPAIRQRMLSILANVDANLAAQVASDLGMAVPTPAPLASTKPVKPEIETSPALSLFARKGDGTIRGRRVAIVIADGVDGDAARTLHAGLLAQGAVPRFLGLRLGAVADQQGKALDVEVTLETTPSVLYDALVLPGGATSSAMLAAAGHALEFVKDQYRHCKPILVLGEARAVVEAAGAPLTLPNGAADPGLLVGDDAATALGLFVNALAAHRHFDREMDPPAV